MKTAVIAVTAKGALLAEQLMAKLHFKADIFAKAGRNPHGIAAEYDSLGDLIAQIFAAYDGLVFIMATGIVVRVIAPFIRDKRLDPAVVVVDEAGQHAISLLSGHIGGANELARSVGEAIGATPVITTATDVNQRPAADILAVKLDLAIEPFDHLKHINAAIANGDRVAFFLDPLLDNQARYHRLAAELGIPLADIAGLEQIESYDAAVIITDKNLNITKPCLFLRPATLSVGLGCRRGTPSGDIFTAINEACRKAGRSTKSIAIIGSSVIKKDEIGLLAAAQQLEAPIEFFSNEQLKKVIDKAGLQVSEFVQKQIGVGNVCEAAALTAGQGDTLILPKTTYRNVAIAIAEVKYRWWE